MAQKTGIITINETAIVEVDGDPNSDGGLDIDVGSVAIDKNTGFLYRKATVSPTGWEILGSGAPSSTFDFSFKGKILVQQNSNFSVGNLAVKVFKEDNRLLEVNGNVTVGAGGKLSIEPNSTVLVRSA